MSNADSPPRMSARAIRGILAYLLVYFAAASYVAGTAWNAGPMAEPLAAIGEKGSDAAPIAIDSVIPGVVVAQEDSVGLLLFGRGYGQGTRVLVNGARAAMARVLTPERLYLQLTPDEQRGASVLAITARSAEDTLPAASSNIAMVVVRNADISRVEWRFWFFGGQSISITAETRFLILTLLLGSLGGVVASINSIGTYRGEDRLFGSWTIHYLVSPFVAGGVTLFLYFTIRAGFLSGTNVVIARDAFPWGLLAISALAGMFYDRSFLKLREVFLTLFRTDDHRTGKLDPKEEPDGDGAAGGAGGEEEEAPEGPSPAPEITTTKLKPATVGQPYEAQLAAKGDPGNLSWSVLPELPGGLQLHPGTGVISGTPVEAAAARSYVFATETLAGTRASASLELEVTP